MPAPGKYSIDLLVSDTTGANVGSRVFSVAATDGKTTTRLATDLDVTAAVAGWHPYHVTGEVPVSGSSLTINFSAAKGQPIASALAIYSDGALQPSRTLLNETFTGPAGGAPDSSVWTNQRGDGWEGTDSIETYTAERTNSALDGEGDLAITAIRQKNSNTNGTVSYTSAELLTKDKFQFGYGHVEASMKLPAGSGMWPALWAKGTDEKLVDWPKCGELDIMEGVGVNPQIVAGHVHSLGDKTDPRGYKDLPEASLGHDWNSGTDTTQGFHTYGMDYRPSSVTFEFDGKPYFVAAPEDLQKGEQWPFDGSPNYLLLDLAVGNTSWTGHVAAQPVGTENTMLINRITVTN